jgi:hypothetical protein
VTPVASSAAGFGRAAPLGTHDAAGALRILVAEIRSAAVTTLGEVAATAPAPSAASTAEATATALAEWLNAAAGGPGAAASGASALAATPPAARAALLTAIVELGYARTLAQLPPGTIGADVALNLHDLVLAALVGSGTAATVAHVPDVPSGLRILVEEVRAAVTTDLQLAAPPSAAAMVAEPGQVGAEPGNVAAQMLGWLRAVADGAGVAPGELRMSVEQGALRAVEALRLAGADPAIHAAVGRAQDVVLAGLALEAAARPGVPLYRPDMVLPVTVGRGAPRARVDDRRRRAPADEVDGAAVEPDGEEPGAEARGRPEGPDLKGPMELIRRYFDDFHSERPGACARHFVLPAGFWSHGRWSGHGDAVALASHYATLRAELAAGGVSGGRLLMLRAEPLAPQVATVFAIMTRESPSGEVLEEIEAAYTTVRTAGGWRIAVVIRR